MAEEVLLNFKGPKKKGGEVQMNLIQRLIASTVATFALLFYALVPAAFATSNIEISGNGANSENEAEVEVESEITVVQENNAKIENKIEAEAETGDNEAEGNTGGNVVVDTGNAVANVEVSNQANANFANVSCPTCVGNIDAIISGNGADSENEIELEHEQSTLIVQENNAKIENKIEAEAETGDNEAEDNTGGDMTIDTGDATANIEVDNWVNFNWADVDCCVFDVSAKISGNGADSKNEIEAEFEDGLEVFQKNCEEDRKNDHKNQDQRDLSSNGNQHQHGRDKCGIENEIEAEVETGGNEVGDNTGPVENDPVEVTTGDAETDVSVSNSANANFFNRGEELDFSDEWDLFFDLGDLFEFFHNTV